MIAGPLGSDDRELELRARLSAFRLQGSTGAARNLLENCLRSFQEGFDAPDLVAARTELQN